ncbi:MAG: metal-dependent transcriptional regulator [Candidatus Natronoplasma sp.]
MKRKTIEEYLEVIYLLEKKKGIAKTGDISSELGVKPPSVTEMLRKLEDEDYLE